MIEGVQALLMRTLEQVTEQIRCLRATNYILEQDLKNKTYNLAIDKHNLYLKETSLNLSMYHGTSLNAG